MSLFYNCFLRLFGDGPISDGAPGGGTFAGGGGGDGGDGGCEGCPPPDPCDEEVALYRCNTTEAGCSFSVSATTRGELVDNGCLIDCNSYLPCANKSLCGDWFEIIEPFSTCEECCLEPPPIQCEYWYCSNENCTQPAVNGGCCDTSTIEFPLSQYTACPEGQQGPFNVNGKDITFYQGAGACVNRERCFGYDAPQGSNGDDPFTSEEQFCDVWKCESNGNCTSFVVGLSKITGATSCDFGTATYAGQGITIYDNQNTCAQNCGCDEAVLDCWRCNGCAGDRGTCQQQSVTYCSNLFPNATCQDIPGAYYDTQEECQVADNECCIDIPGMEFTDNVPTDFDPTILANTFMEVYPCLSAYVEEISAPFVYKFILHPVGCLGSNQGDTCDPLGVCLSYDTTQGAYNPLIIEPTSFQAYQSKLGNLNIEGNSDFYIDSRGRIVWISGISSYFIATQNNFFNPVRTTSELDVKRQCCDNFSLKVGMVFYADNPNGNNPTRSLYDCADSGCDCDQDCFADYATDDHPCADGCAGNSEPLPPIDDDTGASTQAEADYLKSLRKPVTDDILFDPIANGRVYRTRLKNSYVRNTLRTDLFSDRIHVSISYILKSYDTGEAPIDTAFDDVTIYNIEKSLNETASNIISNITDFNRKSLKYPILNRIRYLLISNNLDKFNIQDLASLQTISRTAPSRTYNTLNGERAAIALIDEKAKPLHKDKYAGQSVEAMRLWKTLAPDVNKRINLVKTDGTIEESPVDINDQFSLQLSDGTIEKYDILDGDLFKYINQNGYENYGDVASDIDKAITLDPLDAAEVFSKLNSKLTITLNASSNPDNKIEQTASLTTPREEYYIFKLETSTITDDERDVEIIRVTTADFTRLTDDRDISEWASTKPWPFNVFFIDQEDPILDHILDSDLVKITFKDISFDKFIGYEDQYPYIPRRIPWHVIIVPTDRSSYLLDNLSSKLVAYNKRKLVLGVIPDSQLHSGAIDSPIFNKTIADLGQGLDPRKTDEFGQYKLIYTPTKLSSKYKPYERTQKAVRRASPSRNLFNTLETLQTDGSSFVDIDNTTVSWGTIYKNLSVYDKKTLHSFETINWDQIKSKIVEKTLYESESLKNLFPKVSSVPPTGITNIDDFELKKQVKAVKKVDINPDDTPPDGPIIIP